ncbi:MAG: nucleotide sugar dehydrogenase [Chloroflexi bacterium]|nr:nucleotide sugar dehydrogenase [Chloroflexota bacterium]
MKVNIDKPVVCIVGLGYIGWPLAEAFARSLKVIGFDIDRRKIRKLKEANKNTNLTFTDNAAKIGRARFIIICVPTPITASRQPDLSYIEGAAGLVGKNMKKGSVVILESTVFPGLTEEIVKPLLERESGLKCGRDFKIAYSPERINPGDTVNTLEKITKVVSGMDAETTKAVAGLYRKVTPNVFEAADIRTAEAAKLIENVQRDVNIAFMNELSIIFGRMGLDTREVLRAAATKWNFNRYSPGLVGGHCIPIVPYYLVHKAQELGYRPELVLAARAINDDMPRHVAEMAVKALNRAGKVIKGSRVLILGLTYKEDVPDTRESALTETIKELKEYEVDLSAFDPLLDKQTTETAFGVRAFETFEEAGKHKFDCLILAVAHSAFRRLALGDLKQLMTDRPILIDVKGMFDPQQARAAGIEYKAL